MWWRIYLLLVLVRLWFALSPSYIHPDENFQGPEVIAGQIFEYPVHQTWEFTDSQPIRSIFPLWLVYGIPMLLIRWLWVGSGNSDEIPPITIFWTLRVLMFLLSFVLEDWAIQELIQSQRRRQTAVLLVASSYVTWVYQTHTFSNSIETLVVAWSLVLIQRIVKVSKQQQQYTSSLLPSAILGVVIVFGVFNRITFPAFLLGPGLPMLPHFLSKPTDLAIIALSVIITSTVAVYLDTTFYVSHIVSWTDLISHAIITPLNNLRYNMQLENLAQHGLHPWYLHLLGNLPLLVGPAMLLLLTQPYRSFPLFSACSGILVLSLFQHQEPRFLLPAIPLILSSVRMPRNLTIHRLWVSSWVVFNAIMAIFMGIYHQGGVIPAQIFIAAQPDATNVIWWKTYSPPTWLLSSSNKFLRTKNVMGMPGEALLEILMDLATCDTCPDKCCSDSACEKNGTYLLFPDSTTWLDPYLVNKSLGELRFRAVWRHRRHLNLDDLDLTADGLWGTIRRVVGRRGLTAYRVTKDCD